MEIILLILVMALSGGLAGIRLWLKARGAAERLRRANEGLEARVAERTLALTRALAAADAHQDRIAAADRANADFMLGLGRELRQPLNVVSGFAQLLRLNAADPLSLRQNEAVRRIEAASAGLTALVDEMVDFAAVQTPNLTLSLQRVDLRLALRQVCDALGVDAEKAHVTLDCPPAAAGLGVIADPIRVRQILRRLISDAIRHTPPGGVVRTAIQRSQDQVVALVHDTGFEASSDRIDTLFQPFNGVERDAPTGASLGMAAAQRLAEAMQGGIFAARRKDAGVTFTLRLPAAIPAPVNVPSKAVILYVEADPANVALMRQVISAFGDPPVYVAPTGNEGLALAQALQPDVIVLDTDLPGMDGFELKMRLDADPLTRGLPVVALSASAMPDDIRRGQAAGFTAYLTKPLELQALAGALHDALRSRGMDGGPGVRSAA